jgi:heme exporter protein A
VSDSIISIAGTDAAAAHVATQSVSTPAVRAAGISRRYGRRWALIDVSFSVEPGEALMIAGRNGSGKSTLLRVLSTAIRADRGTGYIFGVDLRHRAGVRQQIALLGHYSYTYEALSALENLQVCARFLGVDSSRAAMMPLLDEVGLAERADDYVMTFSAGMRKRISIARTLLQNAKVVLLDEPYGQLDPPGFRLIDRLVETLKLRGTTLLMATHMLERTAEHCSRGLVLEQGRVAWSGSAADLPTQGGLNAAVLNEGRE